MITIVILLLAVGIWLYGLNPVQRWRYRHIPGPRPAWLLGNAVTMRRKMAHIAYEDWKALYGPVFRIFIGMQPFVVITDPAIIREVGVKQFSTFHDRPVIMLAPAGGKRLNAAQSGMLMARGAYWGSIRAAAQPLFHAASLASFVPSMNAGADELAAILEGAAGSGQPLDFWQHVGRLSLDVTGSTVFGIGFHSQAAGQKQGDMPLVSAVRTIFSGSLNSVLHLLQAVLPEVMRPVIFMVASAFPSARLRALEAARMTLFSNSSSLVDNAWRDLERRGVPVTATRDSGWKWWSSQQATVQDAVPADNSLVSLMLRTRNKETGTGLTDLQVVAQTNTFIAAGYETTANALSFAIYLLAQNTEAVGKLTAEIDALGNKDLSHEDLERLPYTEAVVYETLRMYPPAVLTPRISSAATKIGGFHLPKNTKVHLNIWGTHHDETVWPEPYVFRPERFLAGAAEAKGRHSNAFLGFGVGPRMCIGYKFAIQEAVLVLARLYRDFTFRLASDEPLALRLGMTIAPRDGLPVYVQKRKPSVATSA